MTALIKVKLVWIRFLCRSGFVWVRFCAESGPQTRTWPREARLPARHPGKQHPL